MRFHCLSLPHTQLTKEYIACAYTQKALNFCKMMSSLGHEVFAYAGEQCEADITELVTVYTTEDQARWFGHNDFHTNFFNITWGPNDIHWLEYNQRTIDQIKKRLDKNDIICVIGGSCQEMVGQAFANYNTPVVEYGIGYDGQFADFRVFESYSHMHYSYGKQNISQGRYYDCVIPNYFDPSDFHLNQKEDYYVFLGRFTRLKGIEIAVAAVDKLHGHLKAAGQGVTLKKDGFFSGPDTSVFAPCMEHIGHVDVKQKAELLSKAKACFMPTIYIEPFGGVAIEALLSGTPVIASDFGAFTETIVHGLDGYRFRTIGEAAYYAHPDQLEKLLSPKNIRERAIKRYSMDVIKYKYENYFRQILDIKNGGFYSDWHGDTSRYLT